jgi:hypothetical protein
MRQLIEAAAFLRIAWKAWNNAKSNGTAYAAVEKHGVPCLTMLVAVDREAWRVSNMAIRLAAAENTWKMARRV